MRILVSGGVAAALSLSLASEAKAHIRLDSPEARYAYTSNGQKTGPCGSGSLTGDVTVVAPGQTLLVEWTETINHPGHFRISIDTDGGDDGLVDPTDFDDFYVAPTVLADNIEDNGGSTFSQEITIPNVECELCTLQLIQVMTDKPPWGPEGGDDIYYWCADLRITTEVPPTTATGPGAGGGAGNGGNGAGGSPSSGGSSGDGGAGASGGASGDGSGSEDGCSCSTPASSTSSGAALCLLGAAALAVTHRRRRATSPLRS